MILKGLYTALVTPFNIDGSLDELGLRDLLRLQLDHQVDGVVVLGTTGEAPTLLESEKHKIIEITVEELKGRLQIVVGTGSYSTVQTIHQTLQAEKLGADVALIVAPYYNRPMPEGMYHHFQSVIEASNLPICVYNVPGRCSQNIPTDILYRLSRSPQCIGVKEASGNLAQITDVIQTISFTTPHFSVLSGDDAMTFPLCLMGGNGLISVLSNILPGPMKRLVHYSLQGNVEEARKLHFELLPIMKALFIETNPIPIKGLLNLMGLPAGSCRLPLTNISSENSLNIKKIFQQLDLFNWFSSYAST